MEIEIQSVDPSLAKPIPESGFGFGKIHTDHMFTRWYRPDEGWHGARIGPYEPFVFEPFTAVFHYAQEIFEGTKAYRRPDGHINLFRIDENIRRFNRSALRLDMPTVEEEDHLDAIAGLISLDHAWVPTAPDTALYIRPALIAVDADLGALSSRSFMHFIVLSPVDPYFANGFQPVRVYVENEFVRAVRGGIGEAKTGGNYAASLFVTHKAKAAGCAQVLWLDAIERRFVEEMGGMNICFVYGDTILTPPLTGTILPGVTRDSVIILGRDLGYRIEETEIDIGDVLADIRRGKVTEVFACGTAAVIAPVGSFVFEGADYEIGGGRVGPVTRQIFDELTGIQYGRQPDRFGWTLKIEATGKP